MREQTARWVFWMTVLAVAALIWAIDTWTWACVRDWLFGQTGAAWVQALGSIAAIYIAIRAIKHQLNVQRVAARESMCAVAHVAVELLETCSLTFEPQNRDVPFHLLQNMHQHVGSVRESLSQMPVHELPPDMVRHVFALVSDLAQVQDFIARTMEAFKANDPNCARFLLQIPAAANQARLRYEAMLAATQSWTAPATYPMNLLTQIPENG